MEHVLNDVESWISALAMAGLMVVGWGFGFWRGTRLSQDEREKRDATFSGASMALLGLLLGFTFSMSLTKHEQRRLMVISDANSIGDFFTCASLVKEPVRSRLQKVIRDYAQARLNKPTAASDAADLEKRVAASREAHNQMQALVAEAVEEGTIVVVPLVNTLNDVTSNHSSRVAAAVDRLPPIIFLLLAVAAVITMVLIGDQQGAADERRYGGTVGFVILVAMVVWVILDLNQPQQGMITVSQEPMRRVLQGM